MELTENDKKVIRGIAVVVAERGADFVYPRPGEATPETTPEDWHPVLLSGAYGPGCFNLKLDGSGACIIGALAVNQGLMTNRESSANADAANWNASSAVTFAMQDAQKKQDDGATWGEALEAFDATLANCGVTRKQIESIRK